MKQEVDKLEGVKLTFPSFKYCTDNAVMIAVSGYFKELTQKYEEGEEKYNLLESI